MIAQLLAVLLITGTDLTADPHARAFFWTMLADARYGFSETEEAAFVVRDAEGRLTFVRWPRATDRREARWHGAFRAGTVAIVHTHPNHTPHPSRLDQKAARRKNIPVYVLTRTKITRTTGSDSVVVLQGEWRPSEGRRQKAEGRSDIRLTGF